MGQKWRFLCFLLILPVLAFSQTGEVKPVPTGKEGSVPADTSLHFYLKPVDIFPDKKDMTPRQLHEYTLLELKVKKVYPIAKVAAIKLAEYNKVYSTGRPETPPTKSSRNLRADSLPFSGNPWLSCLGMTSRHSTTLSPKTGSSSTLSDR